MRQRGHLSFAVPAGPLVGRGGRRMRATVQERIERLTEALQRLHRCWRRPLLRAAIAILTGGIVLAYATPPETTLHAICVAGEVDESGMILFEGEALLPNSLPPLLRTDVGARFAVDCRSAWTARPLATIRDRGPPLDDATSARPDPPAAFGPRRLDPRSARILDPVAASFRHAHAPAQRLGDDTRCGRRTLALQTWGRKRLRGSGGRSPPRPPASGRTC